MSMSTVSCNDYIRHACFFAVCMTFLHVHKCDEYSTTALAAAIEIPRVKNNNNSIIIIINSGFTSETREGLFFFFNGFP